MFRSQTDFTRRAAAELLQSDDPDLARIAGAVYDRLTPVTPRQTYGGADLVIAGSALFLQLAELAYTAWSAGRRTADAASEEPTNEPPAGNSEASSDQRNSAPLTTEQVAALIKAMLDTLDTSGKDQAPPTGDFDAEGTTDANGAAP